VKATGTPINVGAIATKESGTDFSDGPNMVAAYFDCVNANGGIDGHPLKLFEQFDQVQPAQITAEAHKLIDDDHVVAMVGNMDLLECTVNAPLFHKLGIYEIDAGISQECWSTPNSAPVSLGGRFSSDGAVQYAVSQHPDKIVYLVLAQPEDGYFKAGIDAIAGAGHVPITTLTYTAPVSDPSSLALNVVDKAGPNGWVVLNTNPPDAATILQAAQKLGLEDHVKGWGCASPCDTDFVAKTLGSKWDHKLFVNAEVQSPFDHNEPEMQLYKGILAKYGHDVSGGIGSFSEFGFLDAAFFVDALKSMKPGGPYTLKNVNQAIVNLKNDANPLECQPWSYGHLSLHIPDNEYSTVTPHNGKMVTIQGCTKLSDADPLIAQYRKAATTAGLAR
jgi:branched-chain amino acid transport system substrate-binding protein